MKLKIAELWKWIAKDKSGQTFMYTDKPVLCDTFWAKSKGFSCGDIAALSCPDLSLYKDSLHEILPDGTLKKHVERPDLKVDTKVLCKYLDKEAWGTRHFAGWSADGAMQCWIGGGTSWTRCPHDLQEWPYWKLPEPDQK